MALRLPTYRPGATTAVLLAANTVLYLGDIAWPGCVPQAVTLLLAAAANLVLVQVLSAGRMYNIVYAALCSITLALFGFLSPFFPVLVGLRLLARWLGVHDLC